ncbi:MAG: hypothetical protein RIE24_20765 [Silicimonas sp.]|jgi:hypothetical protein
MGPAGTASIAWKHGVCAVQALGGMIGPALFLLPDGRQVAPLHVAPWWREPAAATLPGLLRGMRGEWPCVPFGHETKAHTALPEAWRAPGDPEPSAWLHGYPSNHDWSIENLSPNAVRLTIDLPASEPIARIDRQISGDPAAPALDFLLRIHARRSCALPLGLHFTFSLPAQPVAASIVVPDAAWGRTYPMLTEPGVSRFAADARFEALDLMPLATGGTMDATRVPFSFPTEEIALVCGLDRGEASLVNTVAGYRATIRWDERQFPALQLWYSGKGRGGPPWNGRHLALGLEPVCSAFDLGERISGHKNPLSASGVPTVVQLSPKEPFEARYRLEISGLSTVDDPAM